MSFGKPFFSTLPGWHRTLTASRMKRMIFTWRFRALRKLETLLTVEGLYRLLTPLVIVRAVFRGIPSAVALPGCLGAMKSVRSVRPWRPATYLNRTLELIPDRLASAKWAGRCRIDGLQHLQAARDGGRPVVLAFCHFGPFYLLRCWLRAAGFPVATFIAGRPETRSVSRRLANEKAPFPETPPVWYPTQLREVKEFLAAGNLLLIALDTPTGKLLRVPVEPGWTFRMATGGMRMAIRHRAELIPCCIIDEGRWRFRIELGRPVPRELLADETSLARAGKHLLDELLPRFRACPTQCTRHVSDSFERTDETIAGAAQNASQPATPARTTTVQGE
jgi:hypothetical protein